MKNRSLIVILAACLGITAVVACVVGLVAYRSYCKAENRNAIVIVFNQRALRFQAAVHANRLNEVQYINGLKSIDCSSCPKEFALAWLDYVDTADRLLGRGFLGFAIAQAEVKTEEFMAVKSGSSVAAADAVKRENNLDIAEAERKLWRVAAEYGVFQKKN